MPLTARSVCIGVELDETGIERSIKSIRAKGNSGSRHEIDIVSK